MQTIFVRTVIVVFRNVTAAHRGDQYVVNVNFHLLDRLEFEGHVLHCPARSPAVRGGFDDKLMSNGLLAGAAPHLAATEQHLS